MIIPRAPWRIKVYFLCIIMVLISMSAFAGVDYQSKNDLFASKNAHLKPYYRAFTAPEMEKYNKFCEHPHYKRSEYLHQKRLLANQNDMKSAFQYGAIAVFAPCSQINKVVGKTYLNKAADAGSMDAYYLLGLATQSDNSIMMKKAADIGHSKASYNIAIQSEGIKNITLPEIKKYYLYAIEGGLMRARHDYALFLLKNMQKFKESELHYAHALLKAVHEQSEDKTLSAYAAYNIFLLQERYPQIIYSENDASTLLKQAKQYGVLPTIIPKIEPQLKKVQHHKNSRTELANNTATKKSTPPLPSGTMQWEDRATEQFGNDLY